MSQPQKLSEFSDYAPSKDRRGPLPITPMPVNAIGDDPDPTHEIRTLIEQLQQTARDSRARARATELEKDELLGELDRAQQQVVALRANEREMRSHFVEITSLIRERDGAIEDCQRLGKALGDAQKKAENAARERAELARQRDDATRQRDEAARKYDNFQRTTDEQTRFTAETQKQIGAIRLARDGAHAQVIELVEKLGRAEDQIAELGYDRDAAQKAAGDAAAQLSETRRLLDTITTDRDATASQAEQLTRELDGQRHKLLELSERSATPSHQGPNQTAALAEAHAQVTRLSQERDAARVRTQEQARELEDLRQQSQISRENESRNASGALAEAHQKLAALETQARESRHEAANLQQQLLSTSEHLASLRRGADEAQAEQSEAHAQLAALSRDRDAVLTSLNAAQKQIDHIIRERDSVREQARAQTLELEGQLTTLRAQVTAFQSAADETDARHSDFEEVAGRHEKQRAAMIELGAQLQTSQREIRELSASLAEARLQVKFVTAAGRAAKNGATKSDFAQMLSPSPPPPPQFAPVVIDLEDPLANPGVNSAVGAMRQCFQKYTKTPSNRSLLGELHALAESFSERTRVTGLVALHRLSSAFSDLTRGLYEIPERANSSSLRTVEQTIDFLRTLTRERDLAQAQDPAKARIYTVDDDADNCASIAMALEVSMMQTKCAQDPITALTELASSRYDLIFLDVNLPMMDGFELCRSIRQLPHHASTPILFLTGLATLENQVQSSLCGGNDFVAKPFNLAELTVKALTLILKNQLQIG